VRRQIVRPRRGSLCSCLRLCYVYMGRYMSCRLLIGEGGCRCQRQSWRPRLNIPVQYQTETTTGALGMQLCASLVKYTVNYMYLFAAVFPSRECQRDANVDRVCPWFGLWHHVSLKRSYDAGCRNCEYSCRCTNAHLTSVERVMFLFSFLYPLCWGREHRLLSLVKRCKTTLSKIYDTESRDHRLRLDVK